MSSYPPISPRPLEDVDLPEALALCRAAGVHGMYVTNCLAPNSRPPLAVDSDEGGPHPEDRILAFYGAEALLGLAWFGRRGNLILVEREPLDPARLVPAILSVDAGWRIALGSQAVLAGLAQREQHPVLVFREQVYYGLGADLIELDPSESETAGIDPSLITDDVRTPVRKDIPALVDAALELNAADLNVDRWRVNLGWLRDSIKRRIKEDRTRVIGPIGQPWAKLDIGSRGAGGIMIEGVFTREEERGKGHATRLVATVADRALRGTELGCSDQVSLHVDAANEAARRAYERAGLRQLGGCHLLLRS